MACDGLGTGYLAYSLSAGELAVSDDDATVLAAVRGLGGYNSKRLAEFFTFAELSGPETFFEPVSALLPGEMLIVENGRVQRRWLRQPRLDYRIEHARWETYVEEFAELLTSSVSRCLRGLDRVAVLMSGGLDSTPIAALAARLLATGGATAPVTALCWRMSDARADESALIEKMSEHAGVEIEWIDCDDAVPFSDLPNWPVHPSTPQQTAYRWFHQRSFARAAELRHRVVLSGFCGDVLYINARRWVWSLLSAEGPGKAIDCLREVAGSLGWKRTLRTHVFGPLLPLHRGLRRQLPEFLTPRARELHFARPLWPTNLDLALRPHQASRLLALLDARGEGFERHFSSPFGVEMRSPLRDFDLVQFMLAVPDHLLQQGTVTRPILRAASRGLIPEEIRLRKGKAAFYDVLDRGLATEKLRWTRSLLLDPDALWRGFIEESAIRSWVEASPTDSWGKMGYLHAIYGELWRRRRSGLPWPSADAVD